MKRWLVIIYVLIVYSKVCLAIQLNFYVSSLNGSDLNSGESHSMAWKSIEFAVNKAVEKFSQNDCDVVLLIDSGKYEITKEITIKGGSENRRFILKAIKAGCVTLRGDYLINGITGNGLIKQARLKDVDLGVAVGNRNRLDLYCNNQRQSLAGWPNCDCLTIKKPLGPTVLKSGNKKEPIFEYGDWRLNRFSNTKDVYAHGYWANEWRDEYARVSEIDTVNRVMTLDMDFSWGFKEGRPFRLLNLQSELDRVGEFYVDRKDSILYWCSGAYKSSDVLTITRLKTKQMLNIVNSKNVIIDGICFVGGRNDCISVQNSKNVVIRDCSFARFGDTGVKINKSWDITIDGCLFEQIGGWGLMISAGDKVKLKPANVTVSNCIFRSLSNYRETYRQAIHVLGCGVLISHNYFVDHPQSAMRVDANDVIIEYNVFEDLVKKSYDQGAFDIYKNYSFRGIIIRYNYWKNINSKRNVAAVRFDDKISGHIVYGNVFENCGNTYFGAIQIHGGNHNIINHNAFINCPAAISFDRWKKDKFLKALEVDAMDNNLGLFTTEVYKKKYPELNNLWDEDVNRNFISGNLIVNSKEAFRRDGGENEIKNNRIINLPKKHTRNIFRLLKRYGMSDIPFKKIGVERNIFN